MAGSPAGPPSSLSIIWREKHKKGELVLNSNHRIARRILSILLCVLFLFSFCSCGSSAAGKGDVTNINFTATGDNLIHERIYQQANARAGGGNKYDFDYCYEKVGPFYQKQDLNWINQESLANTELPADSYPTFSTPGQAVQSVYKLMKERIFSVSNNHTYDKGAKGLEATLNFYRKEMPKDILYTGIWNKKDLSYIPVYTYKGQKIAFLSYTYYTNGIKTPEDSPYRVIYTDEKDVIKKQIALAKQKADVVIVGCHWGTENSHEVNVEQKKLALNLADWGADLIIGTHPHVVQNAEWITGPKTGRKVFCAYSLGNFISTQSQPDQVVGMVLACTIRVTNTRDGKKVSIVNPRFYPTVTQYGSNASNDHVEWFANYTDEMANSHGIHLQGKTFTRESIRKILTDNVNSKYLVLPKN